MQWRRVDGDTIEGFDGECHARIWRDRPDLFGYDAAFQGYWVTGTAPSPELAKQAVCSFSDRMLEHAKWKK